MTGLPAEVVIGQPILVVDQDQARWYPVAPSPEHQIQVTRTGSLCKTANEQAVITFRNQVRARSAVCVPHLSSYANHVAAPRTAPLGSPRKKRT